MKIFLESRIILKLIGEFDEIIKLLQNISSNDLNKISDEKTIYNLFLAPNGRFLFDNFIFIYDNKIHLDCHTKTCDEIINHIRKYKMRLSIKIEKTDLKVIAAIDEDCNNMENKYLDTRTEKLGYRIYATHLPNNLNNEIKYHKFRINHMIPEGSYDMKSEESFPLYFKMYDLNTISLNKGCYIGQETTNRLSRTTEIRKILKSFEFEKKINHNLEYGAQIEINNKESGMLCNIYDKKFGFVLVNKNIE